ncbi:hypothetical protein P175DRAFT_0466019, partial [Aspergillus ochraceoroseus IBT 24754]
FFFPASHFFVSFFFFSFPLVFSAPPGHCTPRLNSLCYSLRSAFLSPFPPSSLPFFPFFSLHIVLCTWIDLLWIGGI